MRLIKSLIKPNEKMIEIKYKNYENMAKNQIKSNKESTKKIGFFRIRK